MRNHVQIPQVNNFIYQKQLWVNVILHIINEIYFGYKYNRLLGMVIIIYQLTYASLN